MGDSKIVNSPLPSSRIGPNSAISPSHHRKLFRNNDFFISALINSWRQLLIFQIWSTAACYVELAGGLE